MMLQLRQDAAQRATQADAGAYFHLRLPDSGRGLKPTSAPPDSVVGILRYNTRPFASLLQHENSNIIALIERSYKGQTVVCTLYGSRCCLLSCLYSATAALWPRDRGAARSRRAVCRVREHPDHCRVRRG